MRRRARLLPGLAAAMLLIVPLAACQLGGNRTAETDSPAPAAPQTTPAGSPATGPAVAETVTALPQPTPRPGPAASPALPAARALPVQQMPHIYMAVQSDGPGRPVSVVFAIDATRDNTPSDDPAIRLTPENGQCNPHEMRSFNFPPKYVARPVTSEFEQADGLTPHELPAFMAVSVTNELLAAGLAGERDETRALNICTRKLWEELVLAENRPARQ